MLEDDRPTTVVRGLLDDQLLAVLGTHHQGAPYTSLVAFAATSDLRHILFVTGRSTRKWANLTADARASMLIDLGSVQEVAAHEREGFTSVFLDRHPYLAEFTASPSCVMLRLEVRTYILVTRFQHVVELHIQ